MIQSFLGRHLKKCTKPKMEGDPFKQRYPPKRPKKAVLLTSSDLDKIVADSRTHQIVEEEERALRERRESRLRESKELSAALLQRRQPGSELRKRQYALGTKYAKVELDREAKMETRKNKVLEQAYKRLYEETDRVKYFKTAQSSDLAAKGRKDQMATRVSQKNEEERYDVQFLLGTLRDVDQYESEEQEKSAIRQEDEKKNAENWIKRHNEILEKKSREKWEHLRDGYLIRDEDDRDLEKLAKKAEGEKEKMLNYKHSLEQQIKDKQALFDTHHRLEEAEDLKAKLFRDAKDDMKREHQKIKERLDANKNYLRQRVANTLSDKEAKLRAKEQEILEKAVRAAEEKVRENKILKELEKTEAQEDIRKFYEQEVAAKRKKQYDDRLEDYQESRRIADNVDRLIKIEESKAHTHDDLEREAQHMQLHQIAKREVDRKGEEIEAIEDYMNHMRSLDNEEEMFQKYAQMEIEKCEGRGVDAYAMRKAARPGIGCGRGPLLEDRGHIRPRYYAAVWNPEDLTHVGQPKKHADTKSRLGFTLY